jgi:hypothetical protein
MIYTSTPISFGYNLQLSSGSTVMWLVVDCNIQQDRQCTYNVALRRVCATTDAVEKQWVLHNLSLCNCTFRYPACNVHVPYCHLWPALLHNVFPHYLINGTIFGEKATKHRMCVLIYSTTFVQNFSQFKKKWGRYDQKCILVFMSGTS